MRRHYAGLALMIALPAAAQPHTPTTPPADLAQQWLQRVDDGDYRHAWNEAAASLREGTDLARWSADVQRSRNGATEVKCRKLLELEHPGTHGGLTVLFLTEFGDGRQIGEKVALTGPTESALRVAAYRTGPAATDRGPACTSALLGEGAAR